MKKIVYIYVKGGPPPEHAFPRIASCGELHVLALKPLPTTAADRWRPYCASITECGPDLPRGEELVDLVVDYAKNVGADAILTLSEFAMLLVAHAAERLGLAGPGSEGTRRSRDKRLMRQTWADAGVPIPAFRTVADLADLQAAVEVLRPPLLLKPAWGAGSVAQQVLLTREDADSSWEQVRPAIAAGTRAGLDELYETRAAQHLLVEEIIEGSTSGWYDTDDYGDYLSVEGMVANGVYHPLCITGRLPTIPPFTELASTAPSVLPGHLQDRIAAVAQEAVDALKLDTCATHTELKLTAAGEVVLIETAARPGGVLITKEIEVVFGLDPLVLLVRQLLGKQVEYPARMLTKGRCAAASLTLIATDAHGTPWQSSPLWNSAVVHSDSFLSPGSTVEVVTELTIPDGTPMPVYDPTSGSRNWGGVLFLTAVDSDTLLADCHRILNGLEEALRVL